MFKVKVRAVMYLPCIPSYIRRGKEKKLYFNSPSTVGGAGGGTFTSIYSFQNYNTLHILYNTIYI